ncbi:MAG: hypothetical protein AAGD35_14315 [Actinomycetota bacterium]
MSGVGRALFDVALAGFLACVGGGAVAGALLGVATLVEGSVDDGAVALGLVAVPIAAFGGLLGALLGLLLLPVAAVFAALGLHPAVARRAPVIGLVIGAVVGLVAYRFLTSPASGDEELVRDVMAAIGGAAGGLFAGWVLRRRRGTSSPISM